MTMRRNFSKILIANRGEIAVRIIRSAHAMGYRTVAVYSDADSGSLHVKLADEGVWIGPAPVEASYLNAERVLGAAAGAGADAIHPGYGFLSEDASFARACITAGLVFIGPSPEAIGLMGNKAEAKRRMIEAGVPCVPGYHDEDQSDAALTVAADAIGFPILVKAAAGGGGRGMRLVAKKKQLAAALASARSEAFSSFGSSELILEKALVGPRHVEFQIVGDRRGHIIHLGERDCSVQRRHQKVIEEAPCPMMTPQLRERMGQAAVEAARSVKYEGAGTVEFLLDSDGQFYFLEMNTRLQVEHPVTELITGLDLVALQLRIARGEALPIGQQDVMLNGHALEARLYAEDPANKFLPASGRVEVWRPAAGEGVRIDHGLDEGQKISPFYDPMVAKVIAWGADRDEARRRLIRALEQTIVLGPATNRDFLIDVLAHQAFAAEQATTAFLGDEFGDAIGAAQPSPEQAAIAAVLQCRASRERNAALATALSPQLMDWASASSLESRFAYELGNDGPVEFRVHPRGGEVYDVETADGSHRVAIISEARSAVRVLADNVERRLHYFADEEGLIHFELDGRNFRLENVLSRTRGAGGAASSGLVCAPMHGKIVRLHVAHGALVKEAQPICVLEAMKMEHEIVAPVAGAVVAVNVAEGDQIPAGAPILEIERAAS